MDVKINSEIDRQKVADVVADVMNEALETRWDALMSAAELNDQERQWATENLRWTLIDESTGENLLEPEKMLVVPGRNP